MDKVYDGFLFFNELELLDIRLNLLDPIVDHFVIMEATKTFSGLDKPLYYNENKERFSKFADKIIHIVVDDTPEQFIDNSTNMKRETDLDSKCFNKILRTMDYYSHWDRRENQWNRDFFHRECVLRGLVNCQDDDIIILSDLDEIPDVEKLKEFLPTVEHGTFYHLLGSMYQYYVNVKKHETWYGSKVARYSFIKNTESNYMRIHKELGIKIESACRHFTFLGGFDRIKEKIRSYGHQELNRPDILGTIEQNVNSNRDIFYRPDSYFDVDFESEFSEELKNQFRKYPQFIKGYK